LVVAEVEFFGEKFGIVDTPNEFALMEFADAAENVEANTMAALSSVLHLLQESIVADDWQRFRTHARKNRAGSQELMPIVFAVFEQTTERPTGQPADSSAGLVSIAPRSESKPADPAIAMFEGRPDMQAAVLRMRHSA
jgi:hypothetical protein